MDLRRTSKGKWEEKGRYSGQVQRENAIHTREIITSPDKPQSLLQATKENRKGNHS